MIHYTKPACWVKFDYEEVFQILTSAKAAVLSLGSIPIQRDWAEKLQVVQLKREVAGTSRIEGADFTDKELEEALGDDPEALITRSQKQAAATMRAYKWISGLPEDQPITKELILQIHRLIVTGADDDHCEPGELRKEDQNVTLGSPRHRGVEGGPECENVFNTLCDVVSSVFPKYDPLIQALALHYHFSVMHPFLDGNGRTARALEALVLQRTGLRDTLFIAMSNYYYEEKASYLKALAEVRTQNYNLTPFLLFGLKGIQLQCKRLFDEIRVNMSKSLFRNVMYDMFNRLKTTRKRVIAERQMEILKLLLNRNHSLEEMWEKTRYSYASLSNPYPAFIRDLNYLIQLKAISYDKPDEKKYDLFVRLDWATEITETEFYERVKEMPKAKTYKFL